MFNSKILSGLEKNFRSHSDLQRYRKLSFLSRLLKKKERPPIKCETNVYINSSPCRKRVPECPQFIDSGEPSKCLEEGYGKPIVVKRPWFSFGGPVVLKQKPSNNCPLPSPCKKQISFREYIFGLDAPLPDPRTCRRTFKCRQMCNEEDPRLEDPRYEETKGDLYVFSEPERFQICSTPGPRPKSPPPYRLPGSLICKKISDSVADAAPDSRCARVSNQLSEPCVSNLCPIHARTTRRPYEELRPRKPRVKKYFSCKHGISEKDVDQPPPRQACSCVHSGFDRKYSSPPTSESCEFHEALRLRSEAIKRNRVLEVSNRKMSRCERLKLIQMEKQTLFGMPSFKPKEGPKPCEARCQVDAGIPANVS